MFVDTHMHEMTCSKDSFLKLEEMVEIAREKGLGAICITDHDDMGLKEYAAENNITCWISMEERMACGIGACLGCVCKSKDIDAHSQVHNKRVCKDGPVFLSTEVEI